MIGRILGGITITNSYVSGAVDPDSNATNVGGLIGTSTGNMVADLKTISLTPTASLKSGAVPAMIGMVVTTTLTPYQLLLTPIIHRKQPTKPDTLPD